MICWWSTVIKWAESLIFSWCKLSLELHQSSSTIISFVPSFKTVCISCFEYSFNLIIPYLLLIFICLRDSFLLFFLILSSQNFLSYIVIVDSTCIKKTWSFLICVIEIILRENLITYQLLLCSLSANLDRRLFIFVK